MASSLWFLHLAGHIAGPVEDKTLLLLIKEHRISGADFVWTEGMSQWARVMDISPWKQYFPVRPTVPVPKKQIEQEERKNPTITSLRKKRVQAEAYVVFDGAQKYSVLNISETGLIFKGENITSVPGKEVTFSLLSPHFSESFEMTGILVREDYNASQNLIAIEFTRLNPKYRKELQSLVHKIAA